MKKQTILTISICVLLLLSSFALFCAGAETLTDTGQQLRQFDVNADGKITIGDVTTLLNYLSTGCGHNEKYLPGKAPTATEPGYTTGSYCTICREILVEQVEIPALSDIDANLANKGVKSVYVGENGTIWLEFDDGLKIDTGVAGGSTAPLSYTVTFKDWNGTVLKTQTVESGASATAPAAPTREGYTFIGWDQSFAVVNSNLTITALYEASTTSTEPTVTVSNATASAGQEVTVTVSMKNNPGILGMTLELQYDESALQLKKITKGDALGEMTFTTPKNLVSGCRFPWDAEEVLPEDATNGVMLTLTFIVLEEASAGAYSIAFSYDNGAVIDNDMMPVALVLKNGTITVE